MRRGKAARPGRKGDQTTPPTSSRMSTPTTLADDLPRRSRTAQFLDRPDAPEAVLKVLAPQLTQVSAREVAAPDGPTRCDLPAVLDEPGVQLIVLVADQFLVEQADPDQIPSASMRRMQSCRRSLRSP